MYAPSSERDFLAARAPWLLAARVTIPERVGGYLRRPQLLGRCQPLIRRLTLFHAPCGFGKTTLLADICRRERAGGVLTAWLRVDGADSFDGLAAYIEFALNRAGLDVSGSARNSRNSSGTGKHAVRDRMGLLMRAIENYRMPCLLALDEVERLVDPEHIGLIDFLLRRAPRNLHFAMTMRNSPPVLDLATTILDRRGEILDAEDFRFSKPEIALFFDGQLSRTELAEMTERTEGWPATLQIFRNARTGSAVGGEAPGSRTPQSYMEIAAKLLATRLRRDLPDAERDYLLDVSLFDVIDPTMADEVLPETHPRWGPAVLSKFEGLVQPVDATPGMVRLHSLVRRYCARRRLEENPARFRTLHGRIAVAMWRRGSLESALRHASDSGDHFLLGKILEDAGGVRLWSTHGMEQLLSAARFLTPEVIAEFPRLALLRCCDLVARSRLEEGLALYMTLRADTMNFRKDRDGGDDRELWIDSVLVRATLVIFGCQPLGSGIVKRVLADAEQLVTDEQLDPAARGLLYVDLSATDYQRSRFERSRWFLTRAKQCFVLADARYGTVFSDVLLGLVAMAEGRVEEAAQCYERRRPALIAQVLMAELYLERNQLKAHRRLVSRSLLPLGNVEKWLDVHAAAYGVVAELAFERNGAKGALDSVEQALDFATSERLPSLVRHFSALRVSYLVIGGRVAQASRVWRRAGLPEGESELLDLDDQSWREMESISCARIRLLEACEEVEAARRLAEKLRGVARERGLMRTLMRCIALWMSVEYRAGNINAAASRLLEFLRLLRTSDYARPLVRDREISMALLRRVLGTALKPELRATATYLLRQMGAEDAPDAEQTPLYTAREIEVLERVERGLRDKEIARHLDLTEHGVRYHLKNIFRKMGATGRMDAVRHARALGVIR